MPRSPPLGELLPSAFSAESVMLSQPYNTHRRTDIDFMKIAGKMGDRSTLASRWQAGSSWIGFRPILSRAALCPESAQE
jgi:hypothetical protein